MAKPKPLVRYFALQTRTTTSKLPLAWPGKLANPSQIVHGPSERTLHFILRS
jgi:hypothetical protein